MGDAVQGFLAALVIATVTAPVGVSGAVFLLPVQLSLLHVPNPAVTPTNLLYNVVAGPGALLRYRRNGQLAGPLARRLVAGTVPGVVLGAIIRVHLVPGVRPFRLIAAAVLLGVGTWLLRQTLGAARPREALSDRAVLLLALVVGVIGGVYGIGGGSLLSPILVGSGLTVVAVAPAALASTFVTSVVGALTYAVLALTTDGSVAPDWRIGLACGLGGLVGGYAGARLQPWLPERLLRILLGSLAVAVACVYLVQSLR
ncbi:MAG TPA: sulfite exporter TauE/SafE family protein [Nocardioides sp.]|uniref:sulfite exporter TauE/SafE family protein n=1 Tax=Nocardioides sp. TaxID=35761 RepID=UPI002CCB089B|nr:sulfite exporter TauE/SafE family protein [Nocardioides sp.]HQR26063.1 sulfite exporter TauE/SafE family protein [Nocardioides sp.]